MLHRLVEIAVIQDNTSWGVRFSQSQLITENQLESGVTCEIALHLDTPIYWGIDHIAWRVEKDVDFLVNINENFIGTVFTHWDCRSWGVDGTWAEEAKIIADFFEIQHTTWLVLYYLACYQWFDKGCIRQLRVTKINDLIEYLIDQYKIFSNGLLVDNATEIFDYDDDSIQKFKYVGGRYIESSCSHHVDRRFFQIGEIDAFNVKDRLHITFGQFDFAIEELGCVFDKIWSEISVDDGVTPCW